MPKPTTPRSEPVRVELLLHPAGGTTTRLSGELTMTTIVPPPDSNDLGLTFVRQIALPPLYMAYAYGDCTGRIVNGQVHLLFTGSWAGASSPVYEVAITDDPIATFVREWVNPYHDKRGTWIEVAQLEVTANALWQEWLRRRTPDWYAAAIFWRLLADQHKKKDPTSYVWFDFSTSSTPALNGGHYWHEEHQLFYVTYADSYNVAGRPDWHTLAMRLHDDGTTEAHGPFRFKLIDGDGGEHYGPKAAVYLRAHPTTGDLLVASAIMSGNVGCPWGPNLGRMPAAKWPTGTTACGPDPAFDLVCDTRYLYGYYMGTEIDPVTGIAAGDVRSFRRVRDPYIYEHFPPGSGQSNFVDPAAYHGVGSWTDNDSLGGFVPLEDRVLFIGGVSGSPIQDPTDPLAAHIWYASGLNNATCTHDFPAVPAGITGIVSTARFPWACGYAWSVLEQVAGGELPDWQAAPLAEDNLETKHGIVTAPIDSIGNAKMLQSGFFDARTRKLYTIAHGADRGVTTWGIINPYIQEWDVA